METNEFFRQLSAGASEVNELTSIYARENRIPVDLQQAARHVVNLVRNATDRLSETMETIDNIFRWHGGEEIRALLTANAAELTIVDEYRKLLRNAGWFEVDEEP